MRIDGLTEETKKTLAPYFSEERYFGFLRYLYQAGNKDVGLIGVDDEIIVFQGGLVTEYEALEHKKRYGGHGRIVKGLPFYYVVNKENWKIQQVDYYSGKIYEERFTQDYTYPGFKRKNNELTYLLIDADIEKELAKYITEDEFKDFVLEMGKLGAKDILVMGWDKDKVIVLGSLLYHTELSMLAGKGIAKTQIPAHFGIISSEGCKIVDFNDPEDMRLRKRFLPDWYPFYE